MKNLHKNNKGFTIIEVLIVLAIAGLIMLVVFLAVPALQRNSRNTQRKADVSNALGSIGEFVSNNQGALPAGTAVAFNSAFTTSTVKFGFYTPANVTWTNQTAASVLTAPTGNDKILIANYLKCNGNVATVTGASARSVVALYNIEGSGADVAQCQET